jgi:hypothetical protein
MRQSMQYFEDAIRKYLFTFKEVTGEGKDKFKI